MEKSWITSKGAWGGLLVAVGGVATAVGLYLSGSLDLVSTFEKVIPLIGTGLGIIGIRLGMD